MSANHKSLRPSPTRQGERGNAMIYVIIVIALFAALTFLMSRQSDTGESGAVNTEKVKISATSIQQAAAAAQQAIEQMTYTGSSLSCPAGTPMCDWTANPSDPATRCSCTRISFMPPTDSDFNNGTPATGADEDTENTPLYRKAFHPDGGGLSLPRIPQEATRDNGAPPAPGFYIGRFSNVEWSQEIDDPTDFSDPPLTLPADDVMIVAYKITQDVCARINTQLAGAPTIPVLTRAAADIFINNGTNTDFTIADCPACEGKPALCVKDPGATPIWTYYTLILAKDGP